MGTRVLIDSNIVIDLFAGRQEALEAIKPHRDRAISVITWIEVVAGLDATQGHFRDLLSKDFPVIALTPEIAEEAASLRRSTKLKLPDSVILATAHMEKRTLLTRNTKDFRPGRFIEIPYVL